MVCVDDGEDDCDLDDDCDGVIETVCEVVKSTRRLTCTN